MSGLDIRFSALPPVDKAMFLARVVHIATIAAREAYIEDYERPDGLMLRQSNELVHRVTGYIPHVLDGSEGEGQDASVMAMIGSYFRARRLEHYLAKWLDALN